MFKRSLVRKNVKLRTGKYRVGCYSPVHKEITGCAMVSSELETRVLHRTILSRNEENIEKLL
jgi:hypothetical protein